MYPGYRDVDVLADIIVETKELVRANVGFCRCRRSPAILFSAVLSRRTTQSATAREGARVLLQNLGKRSKSWCSGGHWLSVLLCRRQIPSCLPNKGLRFGDLGYGQTIPPKSVVGIHRDLKG